MRARDALEEVGGPAAFFTYAEECRPELHEELIGAMFLPEPESESWLLEVVREINHWKRSHA